MLHPSEDLVIQKHHDRHIIRRLLYGLATSTNVMEEEEELELEVAEEEIHRFIIITIKFIIIGIFLTSSSF